MKFNKFSMLILAVVVVVGLSACSQLQGITDRILGDSKGAVCSGFKAVIDVDVSTIENVGDREKAMQGQKAASDFYMALGCLAA